MNSESELVDTASSFSDSASELVLGTGQQDSLVSVEIPKSTLATPSSRYAVCNPDSGVCDFPRCSVAESKALCALQARDRRVSLHSRNGEEDDHVDEDDEYYLEDFSVYMNSEIRRHELVGLQELFKVGKNTMYFDGELTKGAYGFSLECVSFQEVSIGNYGVEHHTVGNNIWVRSTQNMKSKENNKVWYKLGKSALEYERFFQPFLWLANLAKHVVDFTEARLCRQMEVGVEEFRHEFADWLIEKHGRSPAFSAWFQQHPSRDFRNAVSVNADFLWKEVGGALRNDFKPSSIRLFHEIRTFDQWQRHRSHNTGDKTIVTPYIHRLFQHLDCGQILRKTEPVKGIAVSTGSSTNLEIRLQPLTQKVDIAGIKRGDLVSTLPDAADSGTKWRHRAEAGDKWFGFVQNIKVVKDGKRLFHVTWLYKPCDTPCCGQHYPWQNELFWSDHCSCHGHGDKPILEDEISGKHTVEFFGDPYTKSEFFIRQVYLVEERRWVALQRSDLRCGSSRERTEYAVGDTVFATSKNGSQFHDPYAITEINHDQKLVVLRKLLRRCKIDPCSHAPPNELIFTDQHIHMPASRISGRCIVRVLKSMAELSVPYDRNGAGNAFFVIDRLAGSPDGLSFEPMDGSSAATFRQGFSQPGSGPGEGRPLRGLDLFAGCGNLGRGLEESGAVEVKWVNDIWDVAIHTYMANTKPGVVEPFLGSIDELLRQALNGQYSKAVPAPGEVEFISGGSPCQGFSLLTTDKSSIQQKKNRSLVASFASFVDHYRPKYGILENVINIIQSKGPSVGQDYFSQLICAVVGLGYQVQIILGDAWAHGAPQSRERVFLFFALPDCHLPDAPKPSHAHPEEKRCRALGQMSNGESYVVREAPPVAFTTVPAGDALQGLPKIQDGRPDVCVSFPDHRAQPMTAQELLRVSLIPTAPYGIGFAKAWSEGKGVMTVAERACFPEPGKTRVKPNSRGWTRLDPTRLFSTITTAPAPTDARTGRTLHPQEMRTVSILEIRRAQGMPDNEVLVSSFAHRWKLIGNSVARQMALALGLELRRAVYGTLYDKTGPSSSSGSVANAHPLAGGDATRISVALNMPSPDGVDNKINGAVHLDTTAGTALIEGSAPALNGASATMSIRTSQTSSHAPGVVTSTMTAQVQLSSHQGASMSAPKRALEVDEELRQAEHDKRPRLGPAP